MNDASFQLFLSIGTWTCTAGCVLNLLKLKRRGNSVLILSAAFLAMGALLWLVKSHADQIVITAASFVLAGLLVADIVVRSRNRESRP